MTDISCFNCGKTVDTTKDKMFMTVSWLYKDLVKKNGLKLDKDPGEVVGICSSCWDNSFKKKLDLEDWYWEYNKNV